MPVWANLLNVLGLVLNFLGAIVMLIYSWKASKSLGVMAAYEWEKEFRKEFFPSFLWWFSIGLLLLVFGFVLQLFVAMCPLLLNLLTYLPS